jgi:integrase
MKTPFSLLFYLKKPKVYQSGPVPVYLRITVEGKRAETTSGRECDPIQWNSISGRVKGNREQNRTLNSYLDNLKSQVYEAHRNLMQSGEEITAEVLKNHLVGKPAHARMLVAIFEEHNSKMKALVNNEYASGTMLRYETSLRHTINFMEWKYKLSDIDIKKIDHAFIKEYEFYLRTERKCSNNTTVKYLRNFQKIVKICLDNKWLVNSPFLNFKTKIKIIDRVFLNAEELQDMADKVYATDRLNQVRDVFLFCCFTGLAYADVFKLKRSEIVIGVDGEMWISTKRQKTSTATRVPLLPSALALIDKYKDHPQCNRTGRVLPVLTNQKMNAYLKEVADLCGISKLLTFHIARHTFATTVTLSNGVSIESVSKMLGHNNIRTTQHYAKILDLKVGKDMAILRNMKQFN